MIKNIVFDLGNVLISFRPAEYLTKHNYPENKKRKILEDIFLSQEWLLLDDGKITIEEAINSIACKSTLKREEVVLIFGKRIEIMYPIEVNTKLLPGLIKQGFGLYYLSNFPHDIFDEIKNGYDFFRYFDGGIISSEVKHSKPGIEIFKIFFDKFKLEPEESLFIDDIEENIRTAEKTGMKGFRFTETCSLESCLMQYGFFKVG